MIHLWADAHFNHRGILKHCSRQYSGIHEMNEDLIERWNLFVEPNDTIWFLGDFGFRAPNDPEAGDLWGIFGRLNGRKNLIVGNHDERNPEVLKLPWERVEGLFTLRQEQMRAELCHYPLESWKGSHRGAIMVHGHSHGNLKREVPHRFDVGADVAQFPVRFDMLWHVAQSQRFRPSDHHGDD